MTYHAVIVIVDDNDNVVTRIVRKENKQVDLPKSNTILHVFNMGSLSIPEHKEGFNYENNNE